MLALCGGPPLPSAHFLQQQVCVMTSVVVVVVVVRVVVEVVGWLLSRLLPDNDAMVGDTSKKSPKKHSVLSTSLVLVYARPTGAKNHTGFERL